jgi:dihydrofolate reductase
MTRQVPAIAADPSNEKALFWNPAGASFEQALTVLGTPDGSVGVIGGTDVFGMFLARYDVFHLSRAPDVVDKTTSILACIEYSHVNLDPISQHHLQCLAPFRQCHRLAPD